MKREPFVKRRTLELLSRQVVGTGGRKLAFGVVCPRRGHYAPLMACMACSDSDGIRIGKTQHDNAVICTVDEEDVAAHHGQTTSRASEVTVGEIMNLHVFCVQADLSAHELVKMLLQKRMDAAPVVDALGRPIGVVSRTDVLRWSSEPHSAQQTATVADLMIPVAYSLPANETLARAAALLAFEHLDAVPVLAPTGEVIGVVTAHDVMTWVARSGGYIVDARE